MVSGARWGSQYQIQSICEFRYEEETLEHQFKGTDMWFL